MTKHRQNRETPAATVGSPAALDEKDWEILRTIAHDARMPVSRIARRVGLKRETVQYRLRKLTSSGVVRHFMPLLDFSKVGYPVWGFMLVTFKDLDAKKEREFYEYVKANPHVIFAYTALGEWDYGIEFFAKTPQHLYEIQHELKGRFASILKDVKTGSIIDVHKINYVPNFA